MNVEDRKCNMRLDAKVFTEGCDCNKYTPGDMQFALL